MPVDGLGGATRLVPRESILYLQAAGDYVRVVTEDGRFLLRGTLSGIAVGGVPSASPGCIASSSSTSATWSRSGPS